MSEIETPRGGFCYIASPFSHWNQSVKLERRLFTQHFLYWMAVEQKRPAFAAIVYGWSLAADYRLPDDAEFWEPMNMAMLNAASSIAVLCIDGWRESKGVARELRFAKDLGLPIEYFEKQGPLHSASYVLMPASIMEAA